MKRQIITAVLKLGGEAIVLAVVVGIAIVLLGNWKHWENASQYSNAFFIAGCLLIAGGAFTRQAAGQEWETFQRLSAESFRGLSPGERAEYIVNASSSVRLVILGVLSGILLFLISLLVWNMG